MKRAIALVASVGLIFALAPAAQAELTGGIWKIKTDSVSLNLGGVSPHVEKTSSADRLWFASPAALPDPVMVVDCSESGSCTRQTLHHDLEQMQQS